MESGAIVKGLDVFKECSTCLDAGGKLLMIDCLELEAAPERFDISVVIAVSFAAHRGD